MWREPPSHQQRVALAGIDMHLVVNIFTISVDAVFAFEYVVLFEWFVRTKAVSIDSQRLLLAVGQQESNR